MVQSIPVDKPHDVIAGRFGGKPERAVALAAVFFFLCLLLALSANAQHCPEWNVAADFRVSPNQENPSRDRCGNMNVWYYMESSPLTYPAHLPSNYTLLPEFIDDATFVQGLEEWMGTSISTSIKDKLPEVGINNTGSDTIVLGHILWRAGTVHVHPFANKLAIVGWRSPINGTVSLSGGVIDRDDTCGSGFSWFIDRFDGSTNTTLASGVVSDGSRQDFQDGVGGTGLAEIAVNEGDFLYVIVDPPSVDHGCDSTELTLIIRPAVVIPVMSPALLSVLALGLAIAGALLLGRV